MCLDDGGLSAWDLRVSSAAGKVFKVQDNSFTCFGVSQSMLHVGVSSDGVGKVMNVDFRSIINTFSAAPGSGSSGCGGGGGNASADFTSTVASKINTILVAANTSGTILVGTNVGIEHVDYLR